MLLKIAIVISMLFQLGATVLAVSLVRRTRFNITWVLISLGLVLMAVRRLFDFSVHFWDSRLFTQTDLNSWIGVLISILMFVGVVFIRQLFTLQERIDQLKRENESKVLSAVMQAEEKARRTFAADLHDGLGPLLSSVKMYLSAIDADTLDVKNREIIGRSCRVTDEAIASLKEISNNLSPHVLQNYGLVKAIAAMSDQLTASHGIAVELITKKEAERWEEELEISLYRIVSELLANSVKHARPNHIRIEIDQPGPDLRLFYSDDGCGFDMDSHDEASLPRGMGLENIFSRVKSLNGNYQLRTAPGEGFSIQLIFPLK
ncbi:sensor histidine kinase [Gaoshiqia sediminis]|uniref:histidine kinase n=1 Tax=Gaoshiqia sediminis TaxID=2986998 RepID=A0AA41Y9A0_9BACT|nr:ATP-binding protein [Gaoshiqia sediminis]MCW0483313.1 ATP-binding protein [Gaoshiqia sediminis]